MKALISTTETVKTGYRIAQVETDENIFLVADSLFWIDCADYVVQDEYWYDPLTQTIKPVLEPQPVVNGAQTL